MSLMEFLKFPGIVLGCIFVAMYLPSMIIMGVIRLFTNNDERPSKFTVCECEGSERKMEEESEENDGARVWLFVIIAGVPGVFVIWLLSRLREILIEDGYAVDEIKNLNKKKLWKLVTV